MSSGVTSASQGAVETATGRPVQVDNLSEHTGLTLPGLLDQLKGKLTAADVIVAGIAYTSSLGRLRSPVLLVAGEYDVALPPKCAAEYAGLFPQAELAVQPGGGHFPWLDDPEWLVQTLAAFLR